MSMHAWHISDLQISRQKYFIEVFFFFFFYQKCLSKFAMKLFLPMLRTVLGMRAQKPWADVSPAGVSRLKEVNWKEVMLRTKDSDSIIRTRSDYILNIKVQLWSRSDTSFL